ncbi:hypothetical protein Q0L86_14170, partial [Staphylococcus aureus]|nr:hypothetical protein [Staphylococcus aureus]
MTPTDIALIKDQYAAAQNGASAASAVLHDHAITSHCLGITMGPDEPNMFGHPDAHTPRPIVMARKPTTTSAHQRI